MHNWKRNASDYKGLQKFSDYLQGMHFMIESDHKSFIPLLGSKNLDMLPQCILHFRSRLARCNYSITHVPEKLFYTAHTLTRALPDSRATSLTTLQEIAEKFVDETVSTLPATSQRLEKYQTAQMQNTTYQHRWESIYTQTGWAKKTVLGNTLIPYWNESPPWIKNSCPAVAEERHSTQDTPRTSRDCAVPFAIEIICSGLGYPGKDFAGMIEQCPECSKVVHPGESHS